MKKSISTISTVPTSGKALLVLVLGLTLPFPLLAAKNLDDVSVTLTPPGDPDYFASHVSQVGDLNNDGYDDVVLSSAYYGAKEKGALYVVYGQDQRFADGEVKAVKLTGRSYEGIYVNSVDGNCDVNGDGYSDVLVSTVNYNYDTFSYVRDDRIYILYGRAKKIVSGRITKHNAIDLGDNFTTRIACNGDMNNDGYDDIVIGDPNYDSTTASNVGRVRLIPGHPAELTTDDYTAATTWYGLSGETAIFGQSVGYAGDINADGYDDVLISEPANSQQADRGGKVHLVYGAADGLSEDAINDSVSWYSTTERLYLGSVVMGIGDINADGFADFVITSREYDTDTASNGGVLFIFYGRSKQLRGGNITSTDSRIYGTAYHNYIGTFDSLSFGRLNSDRFSDLVFYAFQLEDATHAGGEVYIQFGEEAKMKATPASALLQYYRAEQLEDTTDSISDISVADLNGDGKADIILVLTTIGQVQIVYR